jgi:hypothetical protein
LFDFKKFLTDANNFVSNAGDLGIVPMSKCDGKANLSGKSLDGSVMFSIVSKED